MLLCDLSATDRKPDHSTLDHFRADLTKGKLPESTFEEINCQLEKHQLLIAENEEDLLTIATTGVVEAA